MSTKKEVYDNFETLVQHIHLTWALNKHVTIGDLAQATGLQYPTVQKILRHPLYKSAFVRHPLHGIILSGLDPDGIDVGEICHRAQAPAQKPAAVQEIQQTPETKPRKTLGNAPARPEYQAKYVNEVDPTVDFGIELLTMMDRLAADPKDQKAWYYIRNRVGLLTAHLERAKGGLKSIRDPENLTIFTDSVASNAPDKTEATNPQSTIPPAANTEPQKIAWMNDAGQWEFGNQKMALSAGQYVASVYPGLITAHSDWVRYQTVIDKAKDEGKPAEYLEQLIAEPDAFRAVMRHLYKSFIPNPENGTFFLDKKECPQITT